MDFQLGKTAAVNIEIFQDCVSQYEKKACQKPANGRKAPTNFQQEAEAGQKFNGRNAYCHRNEQFFRKQAVCGNDAGKGAWVIKLGASGYKKDSAEQEAHKSAKPGGIKKQCPKECQGRPRNIGNFAPVNRIDGTESGQEEAAEKSVKLEAFAPRSQFLKRLSRSGIPILFIIKAAAGGTRCSHASPSAMSLLTSPALMPFCSVDFIQSTSAFSPRD